MTHNIYTDEQIQILSDNPYVSKCSSKYITFTSECKKKSVHLYEQAQLSPQRIFESLLFPEFITQSTFPKDSIKRWRKTMKKEGISWFTGKKKGRHKKAKETEIENRTPEEQILYLQAKIAYLEHENDFLRLLRAED